MRILITEDEPRLLKSLAKALREEGYAVDTADSGGEGLFKAQNYPYDAIVLDVMLPGIDGWNILERLRREKKTPVLMLTARDGPPDRVKGLDLGADDYLVKPFSFDVLLARLRAVSRRGPISQPVVLQVADLALNAASRDVTRNGRRISLTRTEYSLLELLMKRAGRVVTRENLIEAIWGFDSDVRGNTLDAFIRLLRDKIDTEGDAKLIHTVRGVGYAIKPEAA